jgi:hypothetical protein
MMMIYKIPQVLVMLFISVLPGTMLQAQNNKKEKEAAVKEWVDTKSYVFVAQTAVPLGRPLMQLTSEYNLAVKGDTVIAFLPYFGRAFSAPLNPTDGGIKFTSGEVTYISKPRKRNGWEVSMKPKDVPDVQQLRLTIFSSGSASLQVYSTNRQMITFNGFIRKATTSKTG